MMRVNANSDPRMYGNLSPLTNTRQVFACTAAMRNAQRFHIKRAATVNVAVLHGRRKRVDVPVMRVSRHNIHVA